MITLLQSEVNVVPGARAPINPPDSPVGQNCAVLRITNSTAHENAYDIRVTCKSPHWQSEWVGISSLTQFDASGGMSQPSRQDVRLPEGLRVFVTNNGQRQVLLSFEVPKAPMARAGKYSLDIAVRTSVVGDAANRQTTEDQLSTEVFIEPYYDWEVRVEPERRKVGMLRRRARYGLRVVSRGNDWLYCKLGVRQQDNEVSASTPTEWVAVPPPDDLERSRVIPMEVISSIRTWRGNEVVKPLTLRSERIDAPSHPQLGVDQFGALTQTRPDVVLANDKTNDYPVVAADASQPAVVYCPPIRSFVTGFFGGIVNNAKAVVFSLIALLAAFVLYVMIADGFVRSVRVEPLTLQITRPVIPLGGRFLDGGEVTAFTATNTHIPESLPIKADVETGKGVPYDPNRITSMGENARSLLGRLTPGQTKVWHVGIPIEHWRRLRNGDVLRVRVTRASMLRIFMGGVLTYECKTQVMVQKKEPRASGPEPVVGNLLTGDRKPGESLKTFGQAFGSQRGLVLFNGDRQAQITSWSDKLVRYTVPKDLSGSASIQVFPAGSDKGVNAGTINVVQASIPTPGDLGSDGGGSFGGSGGGGGGGSSGLGGGGGGISVRPSAPTGVWKPPVDVRVVTAVHRTPDSSYYAFLGRDFDKAVSQAGSDASGKAIKAAALFMRGGSESEANALTAEAQKQARTGRDWALVYFAKGYAEGNATTWWKKSIDRYPKILLPYAYLAKRLKKIRGGEKEAEKVLEKARQAIPETDPQWSYVKWIE